MLAPREWPQIAARLIGRAVIRTETDGPELIGGAEATGRPL